MEKRKQKNRIGMRGAAIIALSCVCLLCLAFLAFMLPLRQERQSAPSASPVTTLIVANIPTATPAPTVTPPPASVLTFDESADDPMPQINDRLALGRSFQLRGNVQSNYPLLSVSVSISCAYSENLFYPYTQTVTFDPNKGVYSYPLDDALTQEGVSLDSLVQFSELKTGIHTLSVSASSTAQAEPAEVYRTRFYVLSDSWDTIQKSDFSNNSYSTALAFFGDTDAFLYRYQWVDGRYIVADPDWENEYITDFDCVPNTDPWRVHKLAVPYYEEVSFYLNNVHVRVSGTNGDSGVLALYELIDTYNGSYCSRFTSSRQHISHHAFGTASDVNGGMGANDNTKENIALINSEVGDYLVYNGIKTEDGVSYYDYAYNGESLIWTFRSIPETVVNYILYELAFYRAGFQWGHYYVSTSDAMHFTLADNIRISHDGNDGLRKVFEYAESYETRQ